MEEDQEFIKKLMTLLGSGKELKLKSPNGQTIKVSLDGSSLNETDPGSENPSQELAPHLNMAENFDPQNITKPEQETQQFFCFRSEMQELQDEDLEEISQDFNALSQRKEKKNEEITDQLSLEGLDNFDMAEIQKLNENKSSSSKNQDNFFSEFMSDKKEQKPKRVLLSHKNKKQANQPVLNFFKQGQNKIHIDGQSKNQMQIPISISSSPIISRCKQELPERTNYKSETVKQSLLMLKESHPEDKQTFDLINQRILQLQQVQKRVDESMSLINSSISNSLSLKIDSFDISMLSFNQPNTDDPLCYIFAQFLSKAKEVNKRLQTVTPSFLFMYSQPLVDHKGKQIVEQINYFQEELIVQKILKEGKCRVDYIHEPATIQKFHFWIKQGVQIMHFCGHGVKSTQNYLLFENQVAQSVSINSEKLGQLLNQQKRPLKLVFVASCHSQSAGKVFSEAGASHVICIRDEYQILDEACHQFVKLFYLTCINQPMTICESFQFAKKQLSLKSKFTKHQCQKFMLIAKHKRTECKQKFEPTTMKQQFNDLNHKPQFYKSLPSRVEHYIPRCKDLHQILEMIHKKRRFITIVGQSGIGKSTLVRELVRYVQFRNFFRDGVIYLELSRCESMAKVYEVFDLQLFQTPQLKLNKTPGENANRLTKELGEKHLLIVFDNCQSIMISEDRQNFKRLAEIIMKNCTNVYFIFTNRFSIGRQMDYCSEVLYELGRLTDVQAQTLFFQKVAREINKQEKQDFLNLQKNLKQMSKHSFFQFLNGHPQAICLTASLLSSHSLSELHQLLLKPSITEQFNEGLTEDYNPQLGINKVVETAMKISLNVINTKNKGASQMIKILSLLPNGLDSQMMSKIFPQGGKWKQHVKVLLCHSLVQCIQKTGCKYFLVHPHIIIDVQNQINQEEKKKYHQRIYEELVKRLQKIYRNVGTLSINSQRAQELFLLEQDNYKTIFLRELSFLGDKYPLKKFYENVFKVDVEMSEEQDNDFAMEQVKDNQILSNLQASKKRKSLQNQKIVQKKDALDILIVYFVTILFVVRKVKNSPIETYLNYGLIIGQKRSKYLMVANLLRIKACIYLAQGKTAQAKLFFQTARSQFAQLGCGLGSACCQAAMGYIKFSEQQYASAKMNLENALKYYDQIPHPFGKHYLNRWLCSLKSKMNRGQRELINHKLEAQKLLKQTKSNLKMNNINNTSLIKHKFGFFVFRFLFDNISLFLETSFEVDLKPKYINVSQASLFSNAAKNSWGKNILDDIKEEAELNNFSYSNISNLSNQIVAQIVPPQPIISTSKHPNQSLTNSKKEQISQKLKSIRGQMKVSKKTAAYKPPALP